MLTSTVDAPTFQFLEELVKNVEVNQILVTSRFTKCFQSDYLESFRPRTGTKSAPFNSCEKRIT